MDFSDTDENDEEVYEVADDSTLGEYPNRIVTARFGPLISDRLTIRKMFAVVPFNQIE